MFSLSLVKSQFQWEEAFLIPLPSEGGPCLISYSSISTPQTVISLCNFPAFSHLRLAFQCPFQSGSKIPLSFLLPFSCHATKTLGVEHSFEPTLAVYFLLNLFHHHSSIPQWRLLLIKRDKCQNYFQGKISIFLEIKQKKNNQNVIFHSDPKALERKAIHHIQFHKNIHFFSAIW